MVLAASDALYITTQSLAQSDAESLQRETSLAEATIRRAAAKGLTSVRYDATIIGNPTGEPVESGSLSTAAQADFYDLFIEAGFNVGWDSASGYWLFDWASSGIEELVAIYSLRTTLTPGALATDTIAAVEAYFAALTPVVRVKAVSNPNVDETAFGAAASTFYEYTVIATQPDITTDHSAALKAHIIAQGLGYLSGNLGAFKLV